MWRLVRATWLPTVAFAALSFFDRWDPCAGFLLRFGALLTAVVFVPLVWIAYVGRPGPPHLRRAALAGSTCAFLIPTLSYVGVGTWFDLTHSWAWLELGGFAAGIQDLFIIGGALFVAAPVGAVTGILVAWLQRSRLRDLTDQRRSRSPAQARALTFSLWAILASPLLGYLALVVLQAPLSHAFPSRAIGWSSLIAATWIVTIPIALYISGRHRAPRAGDPAAATPASQVVATTPPLTRPARDSSELRR